MKKKTSSISINVLSAMVILLCFLLVAIQPVNAWFTSTHENGIEIVDVFVGNLNLNLYQNSVSTDKIFTLTENAKPENKTKKYITLAGEIEPDVWVPLTLILANDDLGSSGMFVRFKFQLLLKSNDKVVETSITTAQTPDTAIQPENSVADWTYSNVDGWFTYSKGGNQSILNKGENTTLMTHLKVPLSAFEDVDSTDSEITPINNSDTVYIRLTVEAQTTQFA